MVYFYKHFILSKNKILELQLTKWPESPIFKLEYYIRGSNQDHKGIMVTIVLFRLTLDIDLYDIRHKEHYT
jgi:hypothetical protein